MSYTMESDRRENMKSTSIIKGLRAKNNLSQEQLAQKLEMSRQNYNLLENNLISTELDIVFKILKELNVNDVELAEFFNALQQDYMSYLNAKEVQ